MRDEPDQVPQNRPFALVENGAKGLRITAVNAAAARDGITPGTALADARAALPGLLSRTAEPQKDRRALRNLARWAGRYGPSRHVEGDDGIWIDVSGVAHLFGGEEKLLDDLTGRLLTIGAPSQAGLADTLGAANAIARYGCPRDASWAIARTGTTADAIAGLPVEALRLDASAALTLKRLGLKRIGQLYAIPRDSLERRFRTKVDAAGVLRRLDQALGKAAEPMRPIEAPPVLSLMRAFTEPLISSEALEVVLSELCCALAATLKEKDLGARTVRLAFCRADGTSGEAAIAMSAPCREGAHMRRLFTEKLTAIDAGFGVDAVRIEALSVERVRVRQDGFCEDDQLAYAAPAALVDRLTSRFGSDAVAIIEQRASHIPERAESRVPAIAALAVKSPPAFAYAPPWPYAPGPPRPAFMLSRPEPVEVIAAVPDGPPARFVWRRVEHRVIRSEGPERIAPEWWRTLGMSEESKRPRTRDYYRIEDQSGAVYWLFRHGLYTSEDGEVEAAPKWFMHGLFA